VSVFIGCISAEPVASKLSRSLARAAAQLAKNAQAAGEPASVILELIQDALAFAKINKNRLLINELNQMKKQL